MTVRRSLALMAAGLCVAFLGACSKSVEAPVDRGVCWHAAQTRDGKIKFNKVAENVPDLEHCAGQLEALRLKFLGLGGSTHELTGAYQGTWLFLQREGVFTAQSLEGVKYPFMVRTGDGRLAIPGAMPQQ